MPRSWQYLISLSILVSWHAVAAPLEGPRVGLETSAPGRLYREDPQDPRESLPHLRLDAQIFVPVPVRMLLGLMSLTADYAEERRQLTDPRAADATETWRTLGAGALYLPHAKEGKPHFFTAAKRYSSQLFPDHTRPMLELSTGMVIDDYDAPWIPTLNPTDQTQTRLELRWRQYPGFQRWLPILAHKIEQKHGVFLDLCLPLYGLLGWNFISENLRAYTGFRSTPRAYQIDRDERDAASASGWYEGYVNQLLIGAQAPLYQPIYLSFEAGISRETLTLYRDNGHRVDRHITKPMPYLRATLETWLKKP